MEKYGVKTEDEMVKTGAEGKKVCPLCGAELDLSGNVPRCPKHGTEPFEKENDGRE